MRILTNDVKLSSEKICLPVLRMPCHVYRGGNCRRLPAGLPDTGNKPVQRHIAQRDAAQSKLTQIPARTTAEITAIANARGRRIARKFTQRRIRRSLLFIRALRILNDGLERSALDGIPRHNHAALIVLYGLAGFCHGAVMVSSSVIRPQSQRVPLAAGAVE